MNVTLEIQIVRPQRGPPMGTHLDQISKLRHSLSCLAATVNCDVHVSRQMAVASGQQAF